MEAKLQCRISLGGRVLADLSGSRLVRNKYDALRIVSKLIAKGWEQTMFPVYKGRKSPPPQRDRKVLCTSCSTMRPLSRFARRQRSRLKPVCKSCTAKIVPEQKDRKRARLQDILHQRPPLPLPAAPPSPVVPTSPVAGSPTTPPSSPRLPSIEPDFTEWDPRRHRIQDRDGEGIIRRRWLPIEQRPWWRRTRTRLKVLAAVFVELRELVPGFCSGPTPLVRRGSTAQRGRRLQIRTKDMPLYSKPSCRSKVLRKLPFRAVVVVQAAVCGWIQAVSFRGSFRGWLKFEVYDQWHPDWGPRGEDLMADFSNA